MGAEARANAERLALDREKINRLASVTLDFIEGAAKTLEIDLARVAVAFDKPEPNGGRVIATVFASADDDEPADETMLLLRALESVGDKHGVSRKTLAECLLGPDVTLEDAPPQRRPRKGAKEDERRPSRNIGQRRRRGR